MECIKSVLLSGANRWAPMSVLEAHVDCSERRRWGETERAAFRQKLRAAIPTFERLLAQSSRLARQDDSRGEEVAKRLAEGLDQGLPPPQVILYLAQLLQAACGVPAHFGVTVETDEPNVFLLAFHAEAAELGRGCLDTALAIARAAARGETTDLKTQTRLLVDLADDVRLGPSSRAIVRAATARGIPFRRLNAGSLVQFGEGRRQRRTWTAETDATSAIAESIAQDKELTKRMLRAVGVPVPLGRPVADAEDAWTAAQEIGFPVVVKPRRANHARGISLNLTTREQILAAYDWAVKDGDDTGVMVEQYALGQAHRLLVVGQRLIAAARGESEYVIGDGKRSVRELVEEVNRDPRRGENYTDQLTLLKLDDAALLELGKQNLAADSVPEAGQRVLIQPVGDLTTDCTADVHPANAEKAVLAARSVGLDIAGLDVVAQDIRVPLDQQRGAILEVNAGPSLAMHIAPLHGRPQPVGPAIIELLFPPQAPSRITLIAVGGLGDRPSVAAAIDAILRRTRRGVARATTDGFYFDGAKSAAAGNNDSSFIDSLLLHPEAEVGIWESRPEQAAARGLSYGRCDLGVITQLPPPPDEASGDNAWNNAPWGGCLAVAHAVSPDGSLVLPLQSAWSPQLVRAARGKPIYFADKATASEVQRAIATGGCVVFAQGDHVTFARSEGETTVRWHETEPTRRTATLAAWAAAWGAGVLPEGM